MSRNKGRQVIIVKDRKGFTLAELLIVVAIIAVLVAISIPIFSKQLEKSRDATSVANIRSAYAEAMNYALEYNGNGVTWGEKAKDGVQVWVDNTGIVSAVRIQVDIKSHEANNWSGLADNLPFQLQSSNGNATTDDGKYSTSYRKWYVQFNFYSQSAGELQKVMIWHA
ncbi:MAG: type IV pilin protein [Bilifractor sp.]|jgi:prepilin-type N-terminal cleavage/methylation domain-containing protein